MLMFASSFSPVDDNVQTPAPTLVLGRLSLLSDVLRNVLATVYTTNRYILSMFLGPMIQTTQKRESGRSYSCRRSTRGGSYEIRKARLPQSSRQTVRQISVSLITPKSRWYKPGYIIPTYTLFVCAGSSPHTPSSPSIAFAIYSFPTALYNYSTRPTVNNFRSSLSFWSKFVPSNRRQ